MAKKAEVKEEVAEAVSAGKAKLEQAREKFGEVAEKARQGGAQVRESAERAGEFAKEKYGVAVDNLKHGYDRVHKDTEKLVEDVNEYVRDNPGKSVLIAAGIGFFVGVLLRGRR